MSRFQLDSSEVIIGEQELADVFLRVHENLVADEKALTVVVSVTQQGDFLQSEGLVCLNRLDFISAIQSMGLVVQDFVRALSKETGTTEIECLRRFSQHLVEHVSASIREDARGGEE